MTKDKDNGKNVLERVFAAVCSTGYHFDVLETSIEINTLKIAKAKKHKAWKHKIWEKSG